MAFEPIDQCSAPDDDARLRAALALITGKADQVGAVCQRISHGGFSIQSVGAGVQQTAGTEVIDHRDAGLVGDGYDIGQGGLAGEANDLEVRAVGP